LSDGKAVGSVTVSARPKPANGEVRLKTIESSASMLDGPSDQRQKPASRNNRLSGEEPRRRLFTRQASVQWDAMSTIKDVEAARHKGSAPQNPNPFAGAPRWVVK
jgi:hypothetical protein